MIVLLRKLKSCSYHYPGIIDLEQSAECHQLHQEAAVLMMEYYRHLLAWPRIGVDIPTCKSELVFLIKYVDEDQRNKIANLLLK